ncbi:MAG TPA: ATP-binding protein, partial [Pedobacter sp.]
MPDENVSNASPTVSAFPTKQFFVGMLTRDIELQDAILDLLDNCVDGVQRSLERKAEKLEAEQAVSGNGGQSAQARPSANSPLSTEQHKEYEGFWAKIEFDEDFFRISDNCGGIPPDSEAFRLGNPVSEEDRGLATIGYYGIGMKRAIFKMGRSCVVTTKHENYAYRVTITPEWIDDDNLWLLP